MDPHGRTRRTSSIPGTGTSSVSYGKSQSRAPRTDHGQVITAPAQVVLPKPGWLAPAAEKRYHEEAFKLALAKTAGRDPELLRVIRYDRALVRLLAGCLVRKPIRRVRRSYRTQFRSCPYSFCGSVFDAAGPAAWPRES